MAIKHHIIICVLCSLFVLPAFGESVKDLQKKQKKLLKYIMQRFITAVWNFWKKQM